MPTAAPWWQRLLPGWGAPDDQPHPTGHADLPRAMTLPIAVARLVQGDGPAPQLSETVLAKEFGSSPGHESLTMLGAALGTDLSVRKADIKNLRRGQLPAIALTPDGRAVIVEARTREGLHIRGDGNSAVLSVRDAEWHLSGILIFAQVNEAATARLTGRARQWTADQIQAGSILHWLGALMWRHNRSEILQLILAALVSNLFLIALPLFIMSVYDRVIPHSAYETLVTLAVGVMIVLTADLGLRYARLKFIDAIGIRIGRSLQLNLYRRLLNLKLSRRPKSAAVITNVQGELEQICLLLPEFLGASVADTTFALGVLLLIGYIAGPVVVVPLLGIFAVAAVIAHGASRSHRAAQQSVLLRSAAAGQIAETYDSLTAVKATGAEHELLKRFERIGELSALRTHDTRQRLRFANNAAGVLVQMTLVGTICAGVMRIDAGAMSIGSLAAITILVGRGVMPIGTLVDQACRLWTLKDVVSGAFDLVREEEEQGGEADGAHSRTFRGHIAIRQVSYTYDSTDVTALNKLSLEISPGDKIGIVGRNGSGKTTLLHLFPRLYIPSAGTILIDGHDARQYAPKRLRQDIGFMPQETVLFNQTLRDNICLGSMDFSEEDFERAVTLSGVDRFARQHPQGYSMLVGPRGEFLSGGERQAVGLARVLLRPRKMLVLDEPTSMMDHTAEGHVIDALHSWLADTTLIVSTHRLRLLNLVDRVVTLEGGQVASDGPRQQVLKAVTPAASQAA